MTKQYFVKNLIALACVAGSVLIMTASTFAAIPEADAPAPQEEVTITSADVPVTVYAYEYEWRLKTGADGYVYKRLWNCTLARWEGEWIKC